LPCPNPNVIKVRRTWLLKALYWRFSFINGFLGKEIGLL